MHRFLMLMVVLSGCASIEHHQVGSSFRYISANGDTLSLERAPDGWTVFTGHVGWGRPSCESEAFHCIDILSVWLAVPVDVWTRLPATLKCGEAQAIGWQYGIYEYRAWLPSGARGVCGSALLRPISIMGRKLEAISVRVHALGAPERSEPRATFLFSPTHGVVAIDYPFAGANDSTVLRAYLLSDSVGAMRVRP
jgi:uncharacterized protein YceK